MTSETYRRSKRLYFRFGRFCALKIFRHKRLITQDLTVRPRVIGSNTPGKLHQYLSSKTLNQIGLQISLPTCSFRCCFLNNISKVTKISDKIPQTSNICHLNKLFFSFWRTDFLVHFTLERRNKTFKILKQLQNKQYYDNILSPQVNYSLQNKTRCLFKASLIMTRGYKICACF